MKKTRIIIAGAGPVGVVCRSGVRAKRLRREFARSGNRDR